MKRTIAIFAILAVIITIPLPVSAVSKPSAPKLKTAKNTSEGVLLKWSAVKSADKYFVYRKTANTAYSKIASVAKTSYTHKSAVSGKKYTYKIFAVSSAGKSKQSNIKSVIRVGTPALKLSNTASAIKIKWSAIKKADRYVVLYKKSLAKKFSVLCRSKGTSFAYDNMAAGVKYDFKVKAVIGKLSGAYSEAKTQMFLERPIISAEEPLNMKGIEVRWNTVKNANGYLIYRSLKSKNSYKRIKKITDRSATVYTDSDLVSINSYKYYIVAYNGSFKSAKSNVAGDIYGYLENHSTPLALTIKKGEVYKDIYNKINSYGATSLISWKSLNSKTASVDSKGIITGVKKGSATLKATIDPSLFAAMGKTVQEPKTITIEVTVK